MCPSNMCCKSSLAGHVSPCHFGVIQGHQLKLHWCFSDRHGEPCQLPHTCLPEHQHRGLPPRPVHSAAGQRHSGKCAVQQYQHDCAPVQRRRRVGRLRADLRDCHSPQSGHKGETLLVQVELGFKVSACKPQQSTGASARCGLLSCTYSTPSLTADQASCAAHPPDWAGTRTCDIVNRLKVHIVGNAEHGIPPVTSFALHLLQPAGEAAGAGTGRHKTAA